MIIRNKYFASIQVVIAFQCPLLKPITAGYIIFPYSVHNTYVQSIFLLNMLKVDC